MFLPTVILANSPCWNKNKAIWLGISRGPTKRNRWKRNESAYYSSSLSEQQKGFNTYLVHIVNLWNGESSNECCKPRKDVLRKGRHSHRGKWCGKWFYVAGTVDKLVYTKWILVHFYVAAGTLWSLLHYARIQSRWISCNMLRRQTLHVPVCRAPFSRSMPRKLK